MTNQIFYLPQSHVGCMHHQRVFKFKPIQIKPQANPQKSKKLNIRVCCFVNLMGSDQISDHFFQNKIAKLKKLKKLIRYFCQI